MITRETTCRKKIKGKRKNKKGKRKGKGKCKEKAAWQIKLPG